MESNIVGLNRLYDFSEAKISDGNINIQWSAALLLHLTITITTSAALTIALYHMFFLLVFTGLPGSFFLLSFFDFNGKGEHQTLVLKQPVILTFCSTFQIYLVPNSMLKSLLFINLKTGKLDS